MSSDEPAKNGTEVRLVLFHHFPWLIDRVIAVAHKIDHPGQQRSIGVHVGDLDAGLPVLQSQEIAVCSITRRSILK
ncbi:hypothetical protein [Xanthomonas citri]|uniref:hypothetical protein n=1 Tax=Xanthomonas citri TaxID=346 RepID=UPI001A97183C|nr:hypothetical protein [Xanthomonas citri]